MTSRNRILWSATAMAGALSLSASALAAPSNQQVTIGTTQEFETLHPLIATMAASNYISLMADRPLMIIDTKWNWVCELCTTVPSLENGLAKIIEEGGKKKLSVNWELKPGLKWGDGKPVTGEDFRLSWEIGKSQNVSVGSRDTYDRIESLTVDPKDPRKFTIVLNEPRYDFYQQPLTPVPAHIEGPIWAKTKDQNGAYEKQSAFVTTPTNAGLYNGPYVVTEMKLGSHVVLRRNDNFGGKRPAIDKLIIKLVPNTQTLEAALMSGTLDMVSELGMTFDQAVEFEKRIARTPALQDRFKVHFRDGLVYEHVDFNLRNPILADVRVRRAISHAIDRKKLTDALFSGKQAPAISNFHPLDPYFTDKVTIYEPDMKKAAALLEEAGWKLGKDNVRYKDGQKLEINIMTTSDNKTRELVEQYIQAELKKVGAIITIKNEPARVFFGETTRKAAYPGMAMYAWISSPDSPPRSTLHSKEIPTQANGWAGQNSGGWANKRADQILEQVYQEFDFAKRKELMAELQRLYTEEVPVLPLYLRAQIVVTPAKLKNFEVSGHQYYSSLGVENWTMDDKAAH